jgi:hypothetical protein
MKVEKRRKSRLLIGGLILLAGIVTIFCCYGATVLVSTTAKGLSVLGSAQGATNPQAPPPPPAGGAESSSGGEPGEVAPPPPPAEGAEPSSGVEPGEEEQPPEPEYPQFELPPPPPTVRYEIPVEDFHFPEQGAISLRDLDDTLRKALTASGYEQKSYFAVLDEEGQYDGFALVTQLEQFEEDGKPKSAPDRFSLEVSQRQVFSLQEYLEVLFRPGEPGLFRVIVFLITSAAFSTEGEPLGIEGAEELAIKGLNKLPDIIANLEFTDRYTITALIYEFEKPEAGEAKQRQQSGITGKNHIEQSGFLAALQTPSEGE